ncbi:hypothetical protein HYW72_02295 [Candidatus Nomurabacteria bacterium]|nr:hypothetical protein [Candidatus Nomurabacteria bacterium]
MDNIVLNSNNNVVVGNEPMVLLPLDIYEKITKNLSKIKSKNLLMRIKKSNFLATASESSLSKDWFKKEEETAWQNL